MRIEWGITVAVTLIAAAVVRQPYRPMGQIRPETVGLSHWAAANRFHFSCGCRNTAALQTHHRIVVSHGVCRAVTPWQPHIISPFFIKPIQFPFHRVILDILGNVVHFRPIPNDMVMETWLPCKRNVVFVGIFGDSGFVLSNDTRQPPATIGTALHFFVFV